MLLFGPTSLNDRAFLAAGAEVEVTFRLLETSRRSRLWSGLPGLDRKHLTGVKPLQPLDIFVFCQLRWNSVYQRPQHLLSRCKEVGNVHFWEEPVFSSRREPFLQCSKESGGITVITPMLPDSSTEAEALSIQRLLLDEYILKFAYNDIIAWYYTPMALRFSDHLQPVATIYDCMDELSAFQGAPLEMVAQEQQLFQRADVVFCGGASLYASKRHRHGNVHLFPSSIDYHHFAAARTAQADPLDQARIPHPRIGFYGVLDERLDQELLREVARQNPDWHLVLIGPVAKIREEDLPSGPNLHYLGRKEYGQLPAYLANWDIAMLPFARNASTRFISPTKTPEYLAGGKPVISTPIEDVVRPYGEAGLVRIVSDAAEFAVAVREILSRPQPDWLSRVDGMLAGMSWDNTFEAMWGEISQCMTSVAISSGNRLGLEERELNV